MSDDRRDLHDQVLEQLRREAPDEAADIERLLDGIDEIDPPTPSHALRMRLQEAVPGAFGDRRAAAPPPRPAERVDWRNALIAASLLVVGLLIGRMWGENDDQRVEVAALRAELETMGRVVAVSLLDHPSASERIRATELTRLAGAESTVVDALLGAINDDPNDAVRIAAVEALSVRLDRPEVGSRLIDSLGRQDSPMVQLAIADALMQRGRDEELRRARQVDGINPEVRDRLTRVLGEDRI